MFVCNIRLKQKIIDETPWFLTDQKSEILANIGTGICYP